MTAVVLAPLAYYTGNGQKRAAVPPTRRLLARFSTHAGIRAELATWDPNTRTIARL